VVDSGRDQSGVLCLQVLHLGAGDQSRLSFNHHVQRIGRVEAAALLGLAWLQADQVADQPRAVE
jgi:hypothetical protein